MRLMGELAHGAFAAPGTQGDLMSIDATDDLVRPTATGRLTTPDQAAAEAAARTWLTA